MGIEARKEGSHLILFQINQLAGDPSAVPYSVRVAPWHRGLLFSNINLECLMIHHGSATRSEARRAAGPSILNTKIIIAPSSASPTECIPVIIYRWLTSPYITSRIDFSDRFGCVVQQFFRPANWSSDCTRSDERDTHQPWPYRRPKPTHPAEHSP